MFGRRFLAIRLLYRQKPKGKLGYGVERRGQEIGDRWAEGEVC